MNLLHRRLKRLRERKTNQPVVSGKEVKDDLIESLSTSMIPLYDPTNANACFSRVQHPHPLPLITASNSS